MKSNRFCFALLLNLHYLCPQKQEEMKKIICFALALALFSACADNGKEEARRILTEAQGQYDKGNYKESLRLVDSLRRSHPEAVEERRQALTLYQDASENSHSRK